MVVTCNGKQSLFFEGTPVSGIDAIVYRRPLFYDPTPGRFTTLDPFEAPVDDPLHLHKYAYAGNSPAMYSDPSGKDFTLTGFMTTGAIIGGLAGMVGGYSYGVYKTGSYLSPENIKYALVGTAFGAALGAAIGGGAYLVVTGGWSVLGNVLTTGFRQLWTKVQGVHSTTANAAMAGFATGFVTGVMDPNWVVTAASATTTALMIVDDAILRGAMWRKNLLTGLGISTLYELQTLIRLYGQPTTFLSAAFCAGFTVGYATGSAVRIHILDELGITEAANEV